MNELVMHMIGLGIIMIGSLAVVWAVRKRSDHDAKILRWWHLIMFVGAFGLVSWTACDARADRESCIKATVRISQRDGRSTSWGSGCVFHKDSNSLYILTNHHVSGGQGNQVGIEFWLDGHMSKVMPGVVVASRYVEDYHRDIAVVKVQTSLLGGYVPPAIPLALPSDPVEVHGVCSSGCPNASWPNLWVGHVIRRDTGSGDAVHFIPTPAGGRSGSALFDKECNKIVGLIAWRYNSKDTPYSTSMDGKNDSDGYGIAMTHKEIWNTIRGKSPSAGRMLTSHQTIQYTTPGTIIIPHQAPGHCMHHVPMGIDCPT